MKATIQWGRSTSHPYWHSVVSFFVIHLAQYNQHHVANIQHCNDIEIHTFSLNNMHFKMSSAKWWPCCLGLHVLNESNYTMGQVHFTSVLYTNFGILLFHSLQSIWPNTINTTLYNTLYNHNIQHCNGVGTTQIICKRYDIYITTKFYFTAPRFNVKIKLAVVK